MLMLLEGSSRMRATLVHAGSELGLHVEPYASADELLQKRCQPSPILIGDSGDLDFQKLREQLDQSEAVGAAIIYSVADGDHVARALKAIRAGFQDYIVGELSPSQIIQRAFASVDDYRDEVARRHTAIQARKQISVLSARERDVLAGVSVGNSNKQIAKILDISPRTVEIHRANMINKLGLVNSNQAVRIAMLDEMLGATSHSDFPEPQQELSQLRRA